MLSFYQCRNCEKFLISGAPDHQEKHLKSCTGTGLRDPSTDTQYLSRKLRPKLSEAPELEHFRVVTIPSARICLKRIHPLKNENDVDKPKKRKRWRPGSSSEPYINKYQYCCDKCTGKFYSFFEYQRHNDVHNNPDRKPIPCLICQRVFNKRDSLNSHIAAHETAEAKEENLKLLESWPKGKQRQACKFCLLICTSHTSFLEHIRTEHGGTTAASKTLFPCSFDKCCQNFDSMRELVQHAKSSHPLRFFGKLTWTRMTKGTYTGKKSKDKNENANDDDDDDEFVPRITKPGGPIRKSGKTSFAQNQVQSESLDENNSNDVQNLGKRTEQLNERKIKLESVDLVTDLLGLQSPIVSLGTTTNNPSSMVSVSSHLSKVQVKTEIPPVPVKLEPEIGTSTDPFLQTHQAQTEIRNETLDLDGIQVKGEGLFSLGMDLI